MKSKEWKHKEGWDYDTNHINFYIDRCFFSNLYAVNKNNDSYFQEQNVQSAPSSWIYNELVMLLIYLAFILHFV